MCGIFLYALKLLIQKNKWESVTSGHEFALHSDDEFCIVYKIYWKCVRICYKLHYFKEMNLCSKISSMKQKIRVRYASSDVKRINYFYHSWQVFICLFLK